MDEHQKFTEVILLIHCSNEVQLEKAKNTIWKWSPFGVSTFNPPGDDGGVEKVLDIVCLDIVYKRGILSDLQCEEYFNEIEEF